MVRLLLVLAVLPHAAAAEDVSFERAIELAVTRNERAQVAGAQADAADGRLAQARAFFFPTVSVTGQYTRRAFEVVRELNGVQVPLQQLNALNANATARWVLFDARSIPLYRAALADADATRHESNEARRLLAFEAGEAFLQTLALEQVEAAAQHRADLARRNLADARARLSAGLASSNDVTRSELEAASALRDWASAKGGTASARLHLANLLDVPPADLGALLPPSRLLGAVDGLPKELEAAQLEAARAARQDVAAKEARARQAEQLAAEPWLRLVPVLGLTGQVRLTNETGFSGRFYDGYVGVDLTWTLFDGGSRYGARREREATARAAALDAQLKARTVSLEVQQAWVSLGATRESQAQAAQAELVARKNADETAELYRQGLTTAFQLADATVRQFEAEVAAARERYGVLMALLDWRAALGTDPLGQEVAR